MRGLALWGLLLGWIAGSAEPAGPVTAAALWEPGMSVLQGIKQECSLIGGAAFRDCFVQGMEKAGASLPALAFTRRLGDGVFLRKFRRVGPIGIAYVYYPFRANENQSALLVNGTPALIDVDDQQLLATDEL